MDHFERIFYPETMAVVGASNAIDKWGAGIFSGVLEAPELKRVYPVNKKSPEVQGVKAYPTVRDLPETVDFVVIAIPFPGVPDVIRDCVAMGVKSGLIITAGLGETGPEGLQMEREVVSIAREGGLRLVGPNCMGHFNTANDFSTLRMFRMGGSAYPKGKIGVISQSGGFAGHILQAGTEMGAGFSKFVSVGNEADLGFEDFLEYFAQDDETEIITGYIEGLREGRRFFELAKEITRRKPIVVTKVGRTEGGSKAARSHTGHISGSDVIYDAMFKQAGVIRVDEVEELFDVASALLGQPMPKGNRVGILTGGGGFGCVAADACERLGLKVAPLSPQTIERLNEILPERWPHANPVDTVATSGFVTYPCLWPLMEDDNLDALLVLGGIGGMAVMPRGMAMAMMPSGTAADSSASAKEQAEQLLRERERMFESRQQQELRDLDRLFDYMRKYQKPVIAMGRVNEDMKSSPVFTKLKENGIMLYPTPERAAKVLAHLVQYGRYLNDS